MRQADVFDQQRQIFKTVLKSAVRILHLHRPAGDGIRAAHRQLLDTQSNIPTPMRVNASPSQ